MTPDWSQRSEKSTESEIGCLHSLPIPNVSNTVVELNKATISIYQARSRNQSPSLNNQLWFLENELRCVCRGFSYLYRIVLLDKHTKVHLPKIKVGFCEMNFGFSRIRNKLSEVTDNTNKYYQQATEEAAYLKPYNSNKLKLVLNVSFLGYLFI